MFSPLHPGKKKARKQEEKKEESQEIKKEDREKIEESSKSMNKSAKFEASSLMVGTWKQGKTTIFIHKSNSMSIYLNTDEKTVIEVDLTQAKRFSVSFQPFLSIL